VLPVGSSFTAGGQNKTIYSLTRHYECTLVNVYPLIRSVLVCGMVDQYEHNKRPGLVFIGTLTNLMWPQHIESSS